MRQTPTGIRDFKNNSYPIFLHLLKRSFNSPELSYTNRRHGHKVSVRNVLLLKPYYFPLVWSLHYSKYLSEAVDKPPPWWPKWPEDSLSFISCKEGPGILTFLYRLYQDMAIWSGIEVYWEKKQMSFQVLVWRSIRNLREEVNVCKISLWISKETHACFLEQSLSIKFWRFLKLYWFKCL